MLISMSLGGFGRITRQDKEIHFIRLVAIAVHSIFTGATCTTAAACNIIICHKESAESPFSILFFLRNPSWAAAVQSRLTGLHTLLVNKYYFDWFNENVLARASRGLGTLLWKAGDQAVIDGTLVNGSAAAVNWFAGIARRIQTGYLYSYALWMVVGLAVLLGWFLLKAH